MALFTTAKSPGQSAPTAGPLVRTTFAIDDQELTCDNLKLEMLLDGRALTPSTAKDGFVVPSEIAKIIEAREPGDEHTVEINMTCGEYIFELPRMHPGFFNARPWRVGIAYPPYWMERFGHISFETGTWVSYLVTGGEPGVVMSVQHPYPSPGVVDQFLQEQPNAKGKRARDIAYALAVFKTEYQRNRDYLLGVLQTCIAEAMDAADDERCDGKIVQYLTNLYWRGDDELLEPLLQLAGIPRDVADDVGRFYADLLDRRPESMLRELRARSENRQERICRVAGEDEFSINGPKFDKAAEHLQAINDDVAQRCLRQAEQASGRSRVPKQ